MSQNAGAEPKFPMTVRAFFEDADRFLNRGDISLSRSPLMASRLIRLASGSFFSHAAIVFLLPMRHEHFTNSFVLESLFKGVGIANFETYVNGRSPIEEVGILRLEGPGFTQDFFKRANGVLLNEVNKPYDFHRLWRIALSTLFGLQQAVLRMQRRPNVYRRWMPRQFICSGFIQYLKQVTLITGGANRNTCQCASLDFLSRIPQSRETINHFCHIVLIGKSPNDN